MMPDDSPPRLRCRYFAPSDPVDWAETAPVYLRDTVTAQPPRQSTWFKSGWNELELRMLFHAEDTHAWATMTKHDAPLYNEEVVEVFLDPACDLESYFEIEVNPLNAVCDLLLQRTHSGYLKDFGWHCKGLRTAVDKQADFWTVEMSIPFAGLATAPPIAGQTWRANFYRIDRPKDAPDELSAWSPTGVPLFHVQKKFGVLEFVH